MPSSFALGEGFSGVAPSVFVSTLAGFSAFAAYVSFSGSWNATITESSIEVTVKLVFSFRSSTILVLSLYLPDLMPLSGACALGNGASSVTLGMSKTVRLSSSKTLGFREPLPFIVSFRTSCSFSIFTFTIDVAGGRAFGAAAFGNAGSSFCAVFGFSSGFAISTVLVSLKASSIFSAAILVSSVFGVSAAFSVVFALSSSSRLIMLSVSRVSL